jgi:hypothetical protein
MSIMNSGSELVDQMARVESDNNRRTKLHNAAKFSIFAAGLGFVLMLGKTEGTPEKPTLVKEASLEIALIGVGVASLGAAARLDQRYSRSYEQLEQMYGMAMREIATDPEITNLNETINFALAHPGAFTEGLE